MDEKITIVDIAKLANVSPATVSRIINNTAKVNSDKKKKVLELIEEYGFKPNQIAKSLQSSKSNIVGFIVPHINSPYYAQIFYETEIIAQKQGYTLMLCNSESDKQLESDILNAFMSTNVRAIVFMGGRLDDISCDKKYLSEIENVNKKVPVISCVDVPELKCMQIFHGQQNSSNKLLEHLSNLNYKDVALMGGSSNIRTTIKRRDDVINNALKYGVSIRSEIIDSDYSVEGGNIAMKKILKSNNLPQAIICINDLVATGALSEAQKNRMNVPKDIAIVGYDNLDISAFIYPGVTTIASNFNEYSKAIVNAVKNADNINCSEKIIIETDLIIRGTTQLDL
jgi:DNA-binding LacI/PurR family transcriptional regulator